MRFATRMRKIPRDPLTKDPRMTATLPEDVAISDRLDQLAARAGGAQVTLGWILEQLHERAFGLFLLILALPCCKPLITERFGP